MTRTITSMAIALTVALMAMLPAGTGTQAAQQSQREPIPVELPVELRDDPAPAQPSAAEAAAIVAAGATTEAQCFGDDSTLTLTLSSNDPNNPGDQDVVFFNETATGSTGKATLWIAWDFLDSPLDDNEITCDQLAYLQSVLDQIVDTDVHYFGDYNERPAGNENIDVMVYNIVDESYYDPEFPFRIAGYFSSGINEQFDRNMIFMDTKNWAGTLGPDASDTPYLIESIVAHELQHLIHHDHDAGEESFIDEGLADLAELLNGFGHPESHIVNGLAFHRESLTVWGGQLSDYGQAYLFQLYLLENFGSQTGGVWDNTWTRKIVDEQANAGLGVEYATGADFEDLFDAWVLANYLDDPSTSGAGGFPLGYDNIDLTPFVSKNFSPWSIKRAIKDIYGAGHHGNLPIPRYFNHSGNPEFPVGDGAPYSPIYGAYKGMEPQMSVFVRGAAEAGLPPFSGTYEAASGGGHLLTDRILTLNTPVGGTLTFQTWFDIEEEWDYGFVEASTDGGVTWAPLAGNITRLSDDPNSSTAWANSPVAGQASSDKVITGTSASIDTDADGWVQASFTLPAASGVLVRIAYFTDEAVNGQGWFVDDVAVNGFSDGFEAGSGSWGLGGWTLTTGLFANDWMAAFVNPVYANGKFSHNQTGYLNGVVSGGFERINGVVDTSNLNKDEAVVVFANRPGDSPFDAGYTVLVSKLGASK